MRVRQPENLKIFGYGARHTDEKKEVQFDSKFFLGLMLVSEHGISQSIFEINGMTTREDSWLVGI